MGFGACSFDHQQSAVKPSTSNGTPRRRRTRVHCDSFYWDISSVIVKTACLATFFVIESPRRILSFVSRKPQPKPFFTCSKWGYRICACGHHYYHHKDVSPSEKLFSTHSNSQSPQSPTLQGNASVTKSSTKSSETKNSIKRKRKRRWYWPF